MKINTILLTILAVFTPLRVESIGFSDPELSDNNVITDVITKVIITCDCTDECDVNLESKPIPALW